MLLCGECGHVPECPRCSVPMIEKYNGTRGFYYSLETTPFPICRNNEELQENVANFDNEAYLVKCDAFLEEKGCAETGEAAVKIVEFIKKECLEMQ